MLNHLHVWQISNEKFTFKVYTLNGIITDAAPIAKRFIGQPLDNLANWLNKFSPITVHPLEKHTL
jgi:hypothetical protein